MRTAGSSGRGASAPGFGAGSSAAAAKPPAASTAAATREASRGARRRETANGADGYERLLRGRVEVELQRDAERMANVSGESVGYFRSAFRIPAAPTDARAPRGRDRPPRIGAEIGRASCRERVWLCGGG